MSNLHSPGSPAPPSGALPSPAPPLRAVVLGAGRRGIVHARAAAECGVSIAAVVDPDLPRARALAREVGANAVDRPELALLAEPNLALIASPPAVHREQALAMLRAGCDVVMEKPIALCMAEAAEIGAVSREAGRSVVVCQQHRYTAAATVAREILAGRKVALVHVWLYRQAPDVPANWDRSWGGGHIVEWGIHPLDFCRYVIGDVAGVYAAYGEQVLAGTEGWNNWDACACTLRFRNGAVGAMATTYAAWAGAGPFGVDIVAEGVIVRWSGAGLTVQYPDRSESYAESGDPTLHLHRAVSWALTTGDRSVLRQDYRDALASLATVLACNRSHETGRPVEIDELLAELRGPEHAASPTQGERSTLPAE